MALKNLQNALNKRKFIYKQIELDKLHPSEFNVYSESEEFSLTVKGLKESVRLNGFDVEIQVAIPEEHANDEEEYYVVYSGHTRYEVLRELYEQTNDEQYFYVPVKVLCEPISKERERELIIWHNVQRVNKSNKVIHYEIEYFEKKYEELLAENNLPPSSERVDENGNRLPVTKDEYLCICLGCKPRTLRKYKQDLREEQKKSGVNTETSEAESSTEQNEQFYPSNVMEYLKEVEDMISGEFERKASVSVNKKNGQISLKIVSEGIDDFPNLLEAIGLKKV